MPSNLTIGSGNDSFSTSFCRDRHRHIRTACSICGPRCYRLWRGTYRYIPFIAPSRADHFGHDDAKQLRTRSLYDYKRVRRHNTGPGAKTCTHVKNCGDLWCTMLGMYIQALDWVCFCWNGCQAILGGIINWVLPLYPFFLVSSAVVEPCKSVLSALATPALGRGCDAK